MADKPTYDEIENPTAAAQEAERAIYQQPQGERRYRDGLALIRRVRFELDALERQLVDEAHYGDEHTWEQIGGWLGGTTRQNAQLRFGR